MDWLQTFDSSAFIFQILNQHWLVIGFLWGSFKIYAKWSKGTIDDDIVKMIEELKAKHEVNARKIEEINR